MALRSVVLQGFRRVLNLKRKLPVIAGHKLLYSCNLRCRMCPFWRRKDEKLMDLEEERKMMKKLADLGIIFMGFEGGEPLLRRDLPEILKESHDRFHTTLVTNGVLLKNRVEEIKLS
jgi:Predicted Fe-S oxidoreductases